MGGPSWRRLRLSASADSPTTEVEMSTRPARHPSMWARLVVSVLAVAVLVPSVAAAASRDSQQSLSSVNQAAATKNTYVVALNAAPLALYTGGVSGLAATSPESLGKTKLDPNSAASRAYLGYLDTNRTA